MATQYAIFITPVKRTISENFTHFSQYQKAVASLINVVLVLYVMTEDINVTLKMNHIIPVSSVWSDLALNSVLDSRSKEHQTNILRWYRCFSGPQLSSTASIVSIHPQKIKTLMENILKYGIGPSVKTPRYCLRFDHILIFLNEHYVAYQ